jgi:hypothetical protein
MSYSIKNNLIYEFQKDYFNYKQNEPNIIEPIKYPISLSEVRPQIINWLIFLCDNLNFSIQTLFRSIIILEQYLSKLNNCNLTQEKLNLIAISSLSLGTKLEEINCNYTSFFTENILNSPQYKIYKKEDLTKMEFEILKKLNFKTLYSTAIDFSNVYLKIFNVYFHNNEFLIQNFRKMNEMLLKNYLLNDMIITIPQSQISYFIFVECFKILNINILVLRNIENILFNSIIISNKDIINNNCNINALYSL